MDFDAVPAKGIARPISRAAMRRTMPTPFARFSMARKARSATSCCLNAAAALIVAGKAQSIAEGVQTAEMSIDSGAALSRLERLIEVSNA